MEPPPTALESKCSICKKILREPYQAICCGKSFCVNCIKQIKEDGKACPACKRVEEFMIYPNTATKNLLYSQIVFCTHNNQGCDWTGELGQMDKHLNNNSTAENLLKGCDYTAICCPFVGCKVSLQRKDMRDHLTEREMAIDHQLRSAEILNTTQDTVEQLKQQLQSMVEDMNKVKLEVKQLQGEKQYQEQQNTELERRMKVMEKQHELATQVGMAIGQVRFTMDNFQQHKQADDGWFSPPFYTHPQGYKICLCIIANGEGPANKEYTSVLLHMMKGEFDDFLKWPFQVVITVHLLDQEGGEQHHTQKLHITGRTPGDVAKRVTEGERAQFGWGLFQFIKYDKLGTQYLKNDCLCFQIGQIELK